MKFGTWPLDEAEGTLLAHAVRLPDGRLPKGRKLTTDDIERLRAGGQRDVIAARLDAGDIGEDEAAGWIASALAGTDVLAETPATGRSNLFAQKAGLFLPQRSVVDDLNRIDPAITLATLPEHASVEAGRMVATVKIIPLALPRTAVEAAVELVQRSPAWRLQPFRSMAVGLVQTQLPSVKASVLDKTRGAFEVRLRPSGSHLVRERRCDHEAAALAEALSAPAGGEQLTVIFGASAVIDPDDVVPSAVRQAGGTVDHLGMPVDPGNLLLIGRIGERTVIGAPGCARSVRENGFDWVLNRILAGLRVTPQDLTGMGVGGLLMEIASRPQPREAVVDGASNGVSIVLLAAGRSSRMGGPNKLLATIDSKPLVRRSAETALAAGAERVLVVVGHMEAEIVEALAGLPVEIVRNGRFAEGLSTSVQAGFAAAGSAAGVLVMLADQPLLTAQHLRQLMDRFCPTGEGSIVLASDAGQRANPVILSALYRDEIGRLVGDVGARSIVQAHRSAVVEVDLGPAASFDVDTPDLMVRAGGILPVASPGF
ncbi:NTP transferase domain-containing protein [Aureimonas jatrophae]|uniref:Molybdopterin molybdochelatase /molybdenum cofactor cytidylyltransferase n=1 Tax=Aureimonas jatrophae TaxID=1166073 RepID=A0A1H0JL61_9HYPH|nr:molybdopterin-binding/glycosyltransferase family 2 protein [Aureimonas jatrophae]MBB3951361.1 molybdenum cofactor cytidylyltransferase [Aureimonas jatrophae]SDO44111.1 molybdopterin molybdochelatase /molybdenum cofactor cytidylyltransferase [Aureimonas jatrophae]